MTQHIKLHRNSGAVEAASEAQHRPDAIADWALQWERRLRADASEADLEVSQPCNRIRLLLDAPESKNVH